MAQHSFFMAHLSVVPICLNDGKKVNGLRVHELKAALFSAGVPESEHALSKADKLSQLKDVLSKSRASQGPLGALEDGRPIGSLSVADLKSSVAAHGGDPNFQGHLPSELQRLVRLATGRSSPLAVQTTQADQHRRLRSHARAEAAAAANFGRPVLAPIAVGPQVLSPTPMGIEGNDQISAASLLTSAAAGPQGARSPLAFPVTGPSASSNVNNRKDISIASEVDRNKAENKETATEVGAATAVIPTMPRGKETSGGLTKPLNWNFMNRKAKKNWKKTRAKYKGKTQF